MGSSLIILLCVLGGVAAAAGLVVAGMFIKRSQDARQGRAADQQAQQLVEQAKLQAQQLRHQTELDSKDLLVKIRHDFEVQTKETRQTLQTFEQRLMQKEEHLDRKVDLADKKEKQLMEHERVQQQREQATAQRAQEIERLIDEEKRQLERVATLSIDEAKQQLLQRLETDVRAESGAVIKRVEEETKAEGDMRAKKILALAMQRCAAEYTIESSVSVVPLPSDDMKGRIIGREGRNIRAFELATGVDLIVDDTPETVTLSAFDAVRREIAKLTLERLIADGRIHPARIEEVAEKAKKEIENVIREEGAKAVADVGLPPLHPELMRLLGRLRYRTSYGQNVLLHLKEAAHLANVIASELGIDPKLARRAALLHDIGKAVSHEVEGPHALIGADLARKYGEPQDVAHAIEAHHEEVPPSTALALMVIAADACSGSRPGARGDTLENYIKRLKALETLADSFKGVAKSYAIQAGREVRVLVQPDKVSDLEAVALSRDLRKKIEDSLQFPGQIKITVIRETRAIEFAR